MWPFQRTRQYHENELLSLGPFVRIKMQGSSTMILGIGHRGTKENTKIITLSIL